MFPRKSFVEFCGNMISRIQNFLVNAEKLSETIKKPKETEVSYQLPSTLPIPDSKKLDILINDVEAIKIKTFATSEKISDVLYLLNNISTELQTKESKQLNALVEQLKQSTDALSSTVNNERKNENA